jgi:hypothetical protein
VAIWMALLELEIGTERSFILQWRKQGMCCCDDVAQGTHIGREAEFFLFALNVDRLGDGLQTCGADHAGSASKFVAERSQAVSIGGCLALIEARQAILQ